MLRFLASVSIGIRRSVENVLSLNQEHTLELNELPPRFDLEPHTSSKQGLGLINGKLTVLSGIHPSSLPVFQNRPQWIKQIWTQVF